MGGIGTEITEKVIFKKFKRLKPVNREGEDAINEGLESYKIQPEELESTRSEVYVERLALNKEECFFLV